MFNDTEISALYEEAKLHTHLTFLVQNLQTKHKGEIVIQIENSLLEVLSISQWFNSLEISEKLYKASRKLLNEAQPLMVYGNVELQYSPKSVQEFKDIAKEALNWIHLNQGMCFS